VCDLVFFVHSVFPLIPPTTVLITFHSHHYNHHLMHFLFSIKSILYAICRKFSPFFSALNFPRFYWDILDKMIYLKYTVWCFNIHVLYRMITINKLLNVSITAHSLLGEFWWWEYLISTLLTNFNYMLLLTVIFMVYISSLELFCLPSRNFDTVKILFLAI
jgi:hypothetical protein